MTSTSVTRMGGVVVVTQVIPHDEGSIQLQTAAPSTQAPLPATQAPPPATTKMDDMKGVFLRGEPQGLGVRRWGQQEVCPKPNRHFLLRCKSFYSIK